MLHRFGVWYFESGWLIAVALGAAGGWLTGGTKRPARACAILCCFLLIVGAIAYLGKHSSH